MDHTNQDNLSDADLSVDGESLNSFDDFVSASTSSVKVCF